MTIKWRHNSQKVSYQSAMSATWLAREFVLKEFFALDQRTLEHVLDLYEQKYSSGARKYFQATFQKWRTGQVQPRQETQNRILHCVPRFLSEKKQMEILGFYASEHISQAFLAAGSHRISYDEVPGIFCGIASEVRAATPHLDWFVKDIFTDAEIAAFVEVVHYAAIERLQCAYQAVRLDLEAAIDPLASLDANVSVVYTIDRLSTGVPLAGTIQPLPDVPFDLPSMPSLVVRNRDEYLKFLLCYSCEVASERKSQLARHVVAQLDLSAMAKSIASVAKAESITSSFNIRGGGGTFVGSIVRKDIRMMRVQLYGRITLTLLTTLGIVAGIAALFGDKQLGKLGGWACFIGIAIIGSMWSWVQEITKEVREYERGRAAGPTKV